MVYFTTHDIAEHRFERAVFYRSFGKRALDLVLVTVLLPIWLPLVGFLWSLAWLESGIGSYVDMRVGRFGQMFRCVKIRTMRPNTQRRCAAFKRIYDPRITALGAFLRRSSLDELPQLWCVLKGEMSLVGPRPVPELELHKYRAHQSTYLQMRPGLTGLWQVSGRNAISYEERVALDVTYFQTASLWGDLRILGVTVLEVICLNGR